MIIIDILKYDIKLYTFRFFLIFDKAIKQFLRFLLVAVMKLKSEPGSLNDPSFRENVYFWE